MTKGKPNDCKMCFQLKENKLKKYSKVSLKGNQDC